HMEQFGETHQLGNVSQAVLGIVPGTKARAADIHRVSTMQDSLTGNGDIPGGAEKFEVVLGKGHGGNRATGKPPMVAGLIACCTARRSLEQPWRPNVSTQCGCAD